MPTIDDRCYGYEPASGQLKSLRARWSAYENKIRRLENELVVCKESLAKANILAAKLENQVL